MWGIGDLQNDIENHFLNSGVQAFCMKLSIFMPLKWAVLLAILSKGFVLIEAA